MKDIGYSLTVVVFTYEVLALWSQFYFFKQIDNGVAATLIINTSGAGGGCFFDLATEAYCILVVIRIAAYRNRFNNRFYVCFGPMKTLSSKIAANITKITITMITSQIHTGHAAIGGWFSTAVPNA
jgi:hypothetical protein